MLGIATLIGGGLNLFGAFGAAKKREQVAQMNYRISMGNAETERGNTLAALELEDTRNSIALDNARMNLDFALLDAGARNRNAERMRQFAEARSSQSREGIRRQMRSFDQFTSSQKAAIGASGVTGGGSALEVMAESAGQMQIALADMNDQASFERSDSLQRADMEGIGAARDTLQAQGSMLSAERGFLLNKATADLGRISAEANYRTARFGAQIGQLSGQDAAQGMRLGAIGGAFTGFANMLSQRSQANYIGF
jgi:hypothetical protein